MTTLVTSREDERGVRMVHRTVDPPFTGNAAERLFPVLVVPWGEYPQGRPEAGSFMDTLRWGDVKQPANLGDVLVNFDHEPSRVAGIAGDVITNDVGLWCLVKFGLKAVRWIERGCVAVSGETDRQARLSGIALLTEGIPAFPSARVFEPDDVWLSRRPAATGRWRTVPRDDRRWSNGFNGSGGFSLEVGYERVS